MAPIIADYWERAAFPQQLVPKLAKLGVAGATLEGWVLFALWALQCICTSSKWDALCVQAHQHIFKAASTVTCSCCHLRLGQSALLATRAAALLWAPSLPRCARHNPCIPCSRPALHSCTPLQAPVTPALTATAGPSGVQVWVPWPLRGRGWHGLH